MTRNIALLRRLCALNTANAQGYYLLFKRDMRAVVEPRAGPPGRIFGIEIALCRIDP
jgi:hypothetical protein